MVAPEHEVGQRAPADHPAHLQELRDHEEEHEGDDGVAEELQAEVVEAGALEAMQQAEDQPVEGENRDDEGGKQAGPGEDGAAEAEAPQPSAAGALGVEQVGCASVPPTATPLRTPFSSSAKS